MAAKDHTIIETIAYFSCTRLDWSEPELTELLRVCRDKNEQVGVTGFLIYADGSFLQWLEGPPEGIDEVFHRISTDPRHDQISRIFRRSLGQRYFSSWSMAFIPQAELSLEVRSDFVSIRELRDGGGFLKDAPRLAQRVADNFIRANRF